VGAARRLSGLLRLLKSKTTGDLSSASCDTPSIRNHLSQEVQQYSLW
jgi:hypothetical protein